MFLREKRHGFTLLELIIVIIVIGILASIALPRYIRIAEKGRAGEAKNLLSSVRSSQMRYAAQYGHYAVGTLDNASAQGLDINFPAPKYYNMSALAPGNVSDETVAIAQATRTALDNPGLGSYVLNITMGGNVSGDATGISIIQ